MDQLAIDHHGAGVSTSRRSPAPTPSPDEVQIAVAYAEIWGTDLSAAGGAMDGRIKSPWPLGHEKSGTLSVLGTDVEYMSLEDAAAAIERPTADENTVGLLVTPTR